jgi:hypothetical protein
MARMGISTVLQRVVAAVAMAGDARWRRQLRRRQQRRQLRHRSGGGRGRGDTASIAIERSKRQRGAWTLQPCTELQL